MNEIMMKIINKEQETSTITVPIVLLIDNEVNYLLKAFRYDNTFAIEGRSGFRGGDRNDEENSGPRRGGFNPGHGGKLSRSKSLFLVHTYVFLARHDFQDRNNRFRNNQDGGNDGNPRFASMSEV